MRAFQAAAEHFTPDGPVGLRLPEMGPNFKGNATFDIRVSGRDTPHPCGVTLEIRTHFGDTALIVVSKVLGGLN